MGKLTNLTVKGQVTIPKDGRDALGLRPGEPVEIELRGEGEAVIRRGPVGAVPDPGWVAAALARIRRVQQDHRHLAEGLDPDAYMAELREPVPLPSGEA
ncbi:AbrB/MazE/SpoVT family DNA-binding domain-containing protein [Sphingomonas sp. BK580]|uniref:AbrB/MazE/SpoVT family DNA-binding domain-containing protein n=1 Tax=Sphingomonas sp. BK580 TaxID=2586972 RepID=UPI001613CD03|nr:AbrB/MazE/SpoVT family DNA-binding domain-containing protein [Sphingomonas sp. BK580]MBB3693062.1 AbrB family looped-hinge helix DNA binding protein [Sphingomonas sp. BK580]